MKKVFGAIKQITDFLGVFVPAVTFVIIFATFMITIISRYVFKHPVAWSYEISVLGYMWTMFFGVGKAMEADEHVVFGLVYDSLKTKGRMICKVLYNSLLVLLVGIAFIPSVDSLLSKQMTTGVLKLPYTIIFAPFIYMFAEIIVRSILDILKTIREYRTEEKGTVQ